MGRNGHEPMIVSMSKRSREWGNEHGDKSTLANDHGAMGIAVLYDTFGHA